MIAELTTTYPDAFWCDVTSGPEGLGFVRSREREVVFVLEGQEVAVVEVPEHLLSLRACPTGAIGQANGSGRAIFVDRSGWKAFGLAFGQNGVAIRFDGLNNWLYIQRSPASYSVIRAEDGSEQVFSIPFGSTSQGFRDVLQDGTIIFGDEAHRRQVGKVSLAQPMTRGGVTVGQTETGIWAATADNQAMEVIPGAGFEPHIAQHGDRFIACARTPGGAAVTKVFRPPFPVFNPNAPPPPPVDPPKPPPPPPPPMPQLPNYLLTLRDIRKKYPTPLGPRHAEFLIEVAKATKGKLFRKDNGSNVLLPNGIRVSQDILIIEPFWIDILSDAEGKAEPIWDAHTNAQGVFVDVGGFDIPPADPPPPPPPPPDPRIDTLLDIVNRQTAEIAGLKTQLELLKASTPKKGDPIEVTGTVSFGFFSRTVTSRGNL